MRATGIVVGLCVALLTSVAALGAESPEDILKELEGLKQANQELAKRIETLETKAAPADKSAVPPGRFDLGGGVTLKLNGDVRVRNEGMNNELDMDTHVDDTLNWTRVRTRLGADVDYQNKVGAFVQLANEFRWGQQSKANSGLTSRDLFVDNAYVRFNFKELWDAPFVFTAGRQDLLAAPELGWRGMYGEGWLLFDGTPFDGSTSIAFDSAKLRFTGIENVTLDLIYGKINDITPGAAYSPASHFTEAVDEDLYALYAITKPVEGLQADFYAMHRNKNWDAAYAGFRDPELQTTVLGGRLSTTKPIMDDYVSWALEGGYQTGSVNSSDGTVGTIPTTTDRMQRDAYAFYTWARLHDAKKDFECLNPMFEARFDFMSGDDPSTNHRYEGWDSFYAEWPKYSELLIFNLYDSFAAWQGGSNPNLGGFTNLWFPSFTLNLTPSFEPFNKEVNFKFGYRYMSADEKNGQGNGRKFGDLYQFKVMYNFAKGLSSHFEYDLFDPGSYFDRSANNAWFARVELMYSF